MSELNPFSDSVGAAQNPNDSLPPAPVYGSEGGNIFPPLARGNNPLPGIPLAGGPSYNSDDDLLARANKLGDYQQQIWDDKYLTPGAQPSNQTPTANPQYGNDWFGQFMNWENAHLDTGTRALVNTAGEQVLPTVAGYGSAVAGGALAGAAVGAVGLVPGSLAGAVIGGIAGLGAAILGGTMASKAQEAAINQLMSPEDKAAYDAQRQQEMQQAPIQAAVGGLIPQAAGFKFNWEGLKDAYTLIGAATKSRSSRELWSTLQSHPEGLNNLLFAAWGSTDAVRQAQDQIQHGDLNPAVLAINALGGIAFSGKSRLGLDPLTEKFIHAGQDQARALTADGAAKAGQNAADPNPELDRMFNEYRGSLQSAIQRRDALIAQGRPTDSADTEIQQWRDRLDSLRMEQPPAPVAEKSDMQTGRSDSATLPMEGEDPAVTAARHMNDLAKTREAQAQAEAQGLPTFGHQAQAQELENRLSAVQPAPAAEEGKPISSLGFARDQRTTKPAIGAHSIEAIPAALDQAVANSPAAMSAYQALGPIGDVHIVGGAIRNLVGGKPIKDLDMTFGGSESQLVTALEQLQANNPSISFQKTGEHFPVYRLNVNEDQVEISLHRAEDPNDQFNYRTGAGIPIEEDLNRRSETINGLGYDLNTRQIKTPSEAPNALDDLRNKTLNIVSPGAFKGDPVRMLRVLRFVAEGYKPTPELLAQMREDAHLISERQIPVERIQQELVKTFGGDHVGDALRVMQQTGLLHEIFPEVDRAVGFDQRNRYHSQPLFDHMVGVADAFAHINPDPDARLAAFLHDIGKPTSSQDKDNGELSFHGHEDEGAKIAREILGRLKFPSDSIDKVVFLVKNHMFSSKQVLSKPSQFINKMSEGLSGYPSDVADSMLRDRLRDLLDLREADQFNHAVPNDGRVAEMKAALDPFINQPQVREKINLNGHTVMSELGLKPGPQVGQILKKVEAAVLDGIIPNEPHHLLEYARELLGNPRQSLGLARPQVTKAAPAIEQAAPGLYRQVGTGGGFTYDIKTGKQPVQGVSVSVHPDRTVVIPAPALTPQAIVDFSNRNHDYLMGLNRHLGAWLDEKGLVHLDVSEVHGKLDRALEVGKTHNQQAVYDIGAGKEYPVPGYHARTTTGGNDVALSVARGYNITHDLPDFKEHEPVKVDTDRATEIAKFYDSAHPEDPNWVATEGARIFDEYTHDPIIGRELRSRGIQNYDSLVRTAYSDLGREVAEQFKHLPVKVEFTKENPYPNSKAMMADVEKGALKVFKSSDEQSGFGGEMATLDPHTGLTYNDEFRAVHDYFGHAASGFQFGPRGEENAWVHHSKMFTPLARLALTTETRGQNSWVNFFGDHPSLDPTERPYAEQKNLILPLSMTRSPLDMTMWAHPAAQDDYVSAAPEGSVTRESIPISQIHINLKSYGATQKDLDANKGSRTKEPIRLFHNTSNGQLLVEDGMHRIVEAIRSGKTSVSAEIKHAGHSDTVPSVNPEDRYQFHPQGGEHGIQQEAAGQRQEASGSRQDQQASFGTEARPGQQASDINGPATERNAGTGTGSEFGTAEGAFGANRPDAATTTGAANAAADDSNGASRTWSGALHTAPTEAGNGADASTDARAANGTATGDASTDATGATTGASNGAAARDEANGTAAATRTANEASGNAGAGDGSPAQRSSTASNDSTAAGAAGGSDATGAGPGGTLGHKLEAAAISYGVPRPPEGAPLPTVTPLNDDAAFAERLNTRRGPEIDRSSVSLSENAPVPQAVVDEWYGHEADALASELRARGHQVDGVPMGINDDAHLLAILYNGWEGRYFYEDANTYPDKMRFDNDTDRQIFRLLMGVFGDGKSVRENARLALLNFARLKAGLFGSFDKFDPEIRQKLFDLAILQKDGKNTVSGNNIAAALRLAIEDLSRKIGDYGGAILLQDRFPIDVWMRRMMFGSDGAPTDREYDYAVGRTRYLANMLGIPARHVQAALWYGYKDLVARRIGAIREAAFASGDPDLMARASELATPYKINHGDNNFSSAMERYGVKEGSSVPEIPTVNVLARHREALIEFAKSGAVSYRFLKKFDVSSKGKPKDLEDIQIDTKAANEFLKDNATLRNDLATIYERFYLKSDDTFARDLGPVAEELARRAYIMNNGSTTLATKAYQAVRALSFEAPQFDNRALAFMRAPESLLEEHVPIVQQRARELMGDVWGLHDIVLDKSINDKANWSPARPNHANINPELGAYYRVLPGLASRVREEMEFSKDKLSPAAEKELNELLNWMDEAGKNSVGFGVHAGAHEIGHGILHRLMDIRDADGNLTLDPSIVSHKIFEFFSREEGGLDALKLMARGGLAGELDAMIRHVDPDLDLNVVLGGAKKAGRERMPIPLKVAAERVLEHLNYMYNRYKGVPGAKKSFASSETIRRSIYDVENTEATAQILGKIFESRLAQPEVSRAFADEALARSGVRGSSDSTFGGTGREETGTGSIRGPTAEASGQPNSAANRLGDSASPNQGSLGSYRGTPVDNAPDKDLYTRTSRATDLPRRPNETAAQYGDRVAKAANYASADHARQVFEAGQTGLYEPVNKDGQIYVKLDGKLYKGTAREQALSFHRKFVNAIYGKAGEVLSSVESTEPSSKSPTGMPVPDMYTMFGDPKPAEPADVQLKSPIQGKGSRVTNRVQAVPVASQSPTQPPAKPMTPEEFAVIKKALPSAAFSDEEVTAQRQAAHQQMEQALEGEMANQDQGAFDPELADLGITQVVAEAKAQEAQATEDANKAQTTPASVAGSAKAAPKISSAGATPAEQRMNAIAAMKQELEAQVNRWDVAMRQARSVGHEDVANLANEMNDLINETMKSYDFTYGEHSYEEWHNNIVRSIDSMATRYELLGDKMNAVVGDEEANTRIRRAVEQKSDAARARALLDLNDRERALAGLVYDHYQTSGLLMKRLGVLKTYLENYLPHVIVADGKSTQRTTGRLNDNTVHAIERVKNEVTGTDLYGDIDSLQRRLDEVAPGATVKTRLGDIFAAHGKGMSQAMYTRQFVMRASSDLEAPVRVGKSVAMVRPIATAVYVKGLPAELRGMYQRGVNLGPWRSVLEGDTEHSTYYVLKPLGERMERLASSYDVTGAAASVLKKLNTMNSVFKQYKFISPMHAYSMMGNIGTMSGSKLGYLLPAPLVPRVWRLMGRGHEMLTKDTDRLLYYIKAGWNPPRLNVPENMGGINDFMHRLPIIGGGFKAFHHLMWQKVGYEGGLGLTEHLHNQLMNDWKAKHPNEELTEDQKFQLAKEAAAHSRMATGFLNNLDMTKDWDLYGGSLFLANRWTTGQLRTLGKTLGVQSLGNIGGGERYHDTGNGELDKWLTQKDVRMSQRLLIGGLARLLATTTVLGTAVSALMNNGEPSTPFQNYMRDPLHTFDIYTGRDPQTGKDNWIITPFYLFQKELADYALAAPAAMQQGKDLQSVLTAPLAKFAGKANPATRWALEMVMGREIGKWMQGYGDPDISADPTIKNITQSLDNMGIPTFGALGDRIVYTIRTFSPSINYPTNLKAPTNDWGQVANSLGFGTWNPATSGNLPNMAMGLAGVRGATGTQYVMGPNGQMEPIYDAINQSNQKKELAAQLATAAQKGDWATVTAISQQAGFTPGQTKQYILYGAAHPGSGSGGGGTVGGILATKRDPMAPPSQPVPTMLFGKPLDATQEVVYNKALEQRRQQALQIVMNNPAWKSYSSSEKYQAASSAMAYADRITKMQVGQMLGRQPGQALSAASADQMMNEAFTLDKQLTSRITATPSYRQADPNTQAAMVAERSAAAREAVWNKYFGTLKGATTYQLETMVSTQMGLRDQVRQLLPQLTGYSTAMDDYQRQQMLTQAYSYVDGLAMDSMKGKTMKNMDNPMSVSDAFLVARNGLVLQDAAHNMLHQSDVYNSADVKTQEALDRKYANLAHNIALYDVRDKVDLGANQQNLLRGGFAQALQTQLMADEGYNMLVNQYFPEGGMETLKQHQQELAAIKARFAQEQNIPPSKLAHYDNMITAWYDQNNPEYRDFIKARTDWQRRNPLGQAWAAANKDMLTFNSNNPISQFAPDLSV